MKAATTSLQLLLLLLVYVSVCGCGCPCSIISWLPSYPLSNVRYRLGKGPRVGQIRKQDPFQNWKVGWCSFPARSLPSDGMAIRGELSVPLMKHQLDLGSQGNLAHGCLGWKRSCSRELIFGTLQIRNGASFKKSEKWEPLSLSLGGFLETQKKTREKRFIISVNGPLFLSLQVLRSLVLSKDPSAQESPQDPSRKWDTNQTKKTKRKKEAVPFYTKADDRQPWAAQNDRVANLDGNFCRRCFER